MRLLAPDQSAARVPLSSLLDRSSSCRAGMLTRLAGMVPLSALPARSRACRLARLPARMQGAVWGSLCLLVEGVGCRVQGLETGCMMHACPGICRLRACMDACSTHDVPCQRL